MKPDIFNPSNLFFEIGDNNHYVNAIPYNITKPLRSYDIYRFDFDEVYFTFNINWLSGHYMENLISGVNYFSVGRDEREFLQFERSFIR